MASIGSGIFHLLFCWPEEKMGMSQREVAKKMGISRARVFQIEKAALVKLKKRLGQIGITREDVIDGPANQTIQATKKRA